MKLNTLFEGFSKQIYNHQNDTSDDDSASQTSDILRLIDNFQTFEKLILNHIQKETDLHISETKNEIVVAKDDIYGKFLLFKHNGFFAYNNNNQQVLNTSKINQSMELTDMVYKNGEKVTPADFSHMAVFSQYQNVYITLPKIKTVIYKQKYVFGVIEMSYSNALCFAKTLIEYANN